MPDFRRRWSRRTARRRRPSSMRRHALRRSDPSRGNCTSGGSWSRLRELVPSAYNCPFRFPERSGPPCGWASESRHYLRVLKESTLDHTATGTVHGHEHAHVHEHDAHEELGFWRKYIFSLDHKVIGIQYAIT